ncbi:hypothetical protein [Pseudoalteromonas sp. TB41]|jgi:acyl-homoserine-lactone acylase|uniref:hypothetical protein n=1 Tax=Pseudoalteromonas sp. TB41 TaxID=985149 RepID=UPI0020A632C0|nr:hypothetical protein [Pseudoalteromonas sp. TB41]
MKPHLLSLCIASSLLLIGCSEDNDNNVAPPIVVVPDPVPETNAPIIAFDDDNKLDANIRWTTLRCAAYHC